MGQSDPVDSVLRRDLESGHLQRMSDGLQFRLPAYMVYSRDSDIATLKRALDGLRE